MEEEQKLAVEDLKSQLAKCQSQLETSAGTVARLEQQLIEERSGQQRCALLHVLLAKLKTELDKKEKQVISIPNPLSIVWQSIFLEVL